jgi:hypothetical protein
MAICQWCDKDMMDDATTTCIEDDITIDGEDYKQIPYDGDPTERCHDCNVVRGGFHHPGCDMERCPKCNGQIISCNCDDDDDDDDMEMYYE